MLAKSGDFSSFSFTFFYINESENCKIEILLTGLVVDAPSTTSRRVKKEVEIQTGERPKVRHFKPLLGAGELPFPI